MLQHNQCKTITRTAVMYGRRIGHSSLNSLYTVRLRNPASSSSTILTIHSNMIVVGFRPDGRLLNRLLYLYSTTLDNLTYARRLFDRIPDPDVIARTTLLSAFSAASLLHLSLDLFDSTPIRYRDTVFYNAMITALSHNGSAQSAPSLFLSMRRHGFRPDNFTFSSTLSALSVSPHSLLLSSQFHSLLLKSGSSALPSVLNSLLSAYIHSSPSSPVLSARPPIDETPSQSDPSACQVFDEMSSDKNSLSTCLPFEEMSFDGNLISARQVFDEMPSEKNPLSAQQVFDEMSSDKIPFSARQVFDEIPSDRNPLSAQQVFDEIPSEKNPRQVFDAMPSYKNPLTAQQVFDEMSSEKNLFSAQQVFDEMSSDKNPLSVKQVFDELPFDKNPISARQVFDEMSSDKNLLSAQQAFDEMSSDKNALSVQQVFDEIPSDKNPLSARQVFDETSSHKTPLSVSQPFDEMPSYKNLLSETSSNKNPLSETEENLLSGRPLDETDRNKNLPSPRQPFDETPPENLIWARQLFDEMPVKSELPWTNLISGYVQNGLLLRARALFDSLDTPILSAWNAMISGYVTHGLIPDAILLFRSFLANSLSPDRFTFTTLFSACASGLPATARHGLELHARLLRSDPDPTPSVLNSLLSMYWRWSSRGKAEILFNRMHQRDDVTWNAMITGYIRAGAIPDALRLFREAPSRGTLTWAVVIAGCGQHGFGEDGLRLFAEMRSTTAAAAACEYALAGALASCSGLGSLQHGVQLHGLAVRSGFGASSSANNALITMYSRCGSVDSSAAVFREMGAEADPVSWNAMIAAWGHHGHGGRATRLYERMLRAGILPDRVTFLIVLSACGYSGMVPEGRRYFRSMKEDYGMSPGEEHYARMVDLLCRAGELKEAERVIGSMGRVDPGVMVWEALLCGCRAHGDVEMGARVAERLFSKAPEDDGTYVLAANMFAAAGRREEAAEARRRMRERGVRKEPACSWIEVGPKVHVFLAGDTAHPEAEQVFEYLRGVEAGMRAAGYSPDTSQVLQEMENEEQKELALATHSERIAVGYGLMRLPAGAPVRVFKNLRICGDCHNAFKFLCEVVAREIIVRDAKRFHRFAHGVCSCGDYW